MNKQIIKLREEKQRMFLKAIRPILERQLNPRLVGDKK